MRRRAALAVVWALAALVGAVPAAVAQEPAEPGPAAPAPGASEDGGSTVTADEATGTGQVVIADGHVDIGPRYVDGEWTFQVRDDTVRPAVWREPSDVVLAAVDAAQVELPDDPAFAFLGEPGSQVWLLPQVQQQGVVWPGWNTEHPDVATTVAREMTWRLHGVEGPGTFVLFLNGEFGAPETIFDGAQPLPQEAGVDANTHVHGNWVFSEPGVYRLDMEMAATNLDGTEVTDRATLQVAVGDGTDPATAFAAAEGADSGEDAAADGASEGGAGLPSPGALDDTEPAAATAAGGPGTALTVGALAVLAVVLVAAVVLVRRGRTPAPGVATDPGRELR